MRFTKVPTKGVMLAMHAIESLFQQMPTMQWTDYLDIAVVAFLIYRLLPLIKTATTARATRTVLGVSMRGSSR